MLLVETMWGDSPRTDLTDCVRTRVESLSCDGALCVEEDGAEITVRDVIDCENPFEDIGSTEVILALQGGFDTGTAMGHVDVNVDASGDDVDVGLTLALAVYSYGFWGEHGFVAAQTLVAPLSGEAEGTPYHGKASYAAAFAVGDAAGTSPMGMGSATWRGIAEAAYTHSVPRLGRLFEPLMKVHFPDDPLYMNRFRFRVVVQVCGGLPRPR